MKTDAVILAGGRATPEMAALTGTDVRALFPYHGKPFVQWVYEALRGCPEVERIAIVGPPSLQDHPGLSGADVLVPERNSLTSNLFAAVEALAPRQRVLITASDNPLLSTAAFRDFLDRTAPDVELAYPILQHVTFLGQFPHAANIAVKLKDGAFIGGDCVLIRMEAFDRLRSAISNVVAARKSLAKMVKLLGPVFAAKFIARRVTVDDVEQRVTEITGVRFQFVRDSDPAFVIDIDDPEDWEYLKRWNETVEPRMDTNGHE